MLSALQAGVRNARRAGAAQCTDIALSRLSEEALVVVTERVQTTSTTTHLQHLANLGDISVGLHSQGRSVRTTDFFKRISAKLPGACNGRGTATTSSTNAFGPHLHAR